MTIYKRFSFNSPRMSLCKSNWNNLYLYLSYCLGLVCLKIMEIAFLSRWLWGWNIQDVWHQDKRFSFFLVVVVVVVFLLSENICFVEREVKTCSNGKHFIDLTLTLEWVRERRSLIVIRMIENYEHNSQNHFM